MIISRRTMCFVCQRREYGLTNKQEGIVYLILHYLHTISPYPYDITRWDLTSVVLPRKEFLSSLYHGETLSMWKSPIAFTNYLKSTSPFTFLRIKKWRRVIAVHPLDLCEYFPSCGRRPFLRWLCQRRHVCCRGRGLGLWLWRIESHWYLDQHSPSTKVPVPYAYE